MVRGSAGVVDIDNVAVLSPDGSPHSLGILLHISPACFGESRFLLLLDFAVFGFLVVLFGPCFFSCVCSVLPYGSCPKKWVKYQFGQGCLG